ncbi:hypothetical protein GRF61_23830 [Azoarcus sp. TTM-91]|uniref:hypothetical protein n=1 Tax=Azoarcus sp. TTM-91 TaxID=2691581 RepID=UPI00145E6238|nr:hypothetical protein [Azoarcus sp. TTM-91]NMG37492.1 hypothetical protein [Azoarcus sp. TTM-91]
MSLDPNAPFALYQTHLELLLRLGNLAQEGSCRLLSDSRRTLERAAAVQRSESARIQAARDWEGLHAASTAFATDALTQQTEDLRRFATHAVENQLEFAGRLGDAFADWQRATTGILRASLRGGA